MTNPNDPNQASSEFRKAPNRTCPSSFIGILVVLVLTVQTLMFSAMKSPFDDDMLPTRRRSEVIVGNDATLLDENKTVHVAFSLSGNHSGFLAEFEVALKSVLLNAPQDAALEIHILADAQAYSCLLDIWNRAGLEKSMWKIPITITSYNVNVMIDKWIERIQDLFHKPIAQVSVRHTIAAYFRLFLHQVLPPHVNHVVYMDTDVVIMANLVNLWGYVSNGLIFQWGDDYCSGFILLNVKKLPLLWDIASGMNIQALAKQFDRKYDDQMILAGINQTRPKMVGFLPKEWTLSIANGLWKHTHHLVSYRPQVGMFHFNGGGSSKTSYWNDPSSLIPANPDTCGIASYYINLPWSWVLFMGKSHLVYVTVRDTT